MRTRVKLLITLATVGTCLARADGPPPAPAPAPKPPGAVSRPRWPGPIDGNRAPVLVLDIGARLVACPGGTIEAAEIDISGLRYELSEACRDTNQRGHIEISGIAGQSTAAPREDHPADQKDSTPRPITRCDPATWNCTPVQR